MSDTVKLIIEIPKKTIAHIRSDYGHGYKGLLDKDREIIVNAIYNATPLDDVKAEIEHMACRQYEHRLTLDRQEVIDILNNIDKTESEDT